MMSERMYWTGSAKPTAGRFFALVVLMAGLWSGDAFADEPVDAAAKQNRGDVGLTVEEVVDRALNQPTFDEELEARRAEARAAAKVERQWPNPVAGWEREQMNEDVGWVDEDVVLLEQAIPGPARRMRARAAEADARIAETEDRERRVGLAARVRESFWRTVAVDAEHDELEDWEDRLEEALETLKARRKAGDVSKFEVLRLEQEIQEVRAELERFRAEQAQVRGELAALAGLEFGGDWRAQGDMTGLVGGEALPEIGELLEALAQRPSFRALRQRSEQSEFNVKAARRQWWPEPVVGAGYKRVAEPTQAFHGFFIELSFALPVFRAGGPQASVARAQKRRVEVLLERELSREETRLRAHYRRAQKLRAAASHYRKRALSQARRVVETARTSYRAGEVGILELLDAHRGLTAAERKLIEVALEARLARIDLLRMAGEGN